MDKFNRSTLRLAQVVHRGLCGTTLRPLEQIEERLDRVLAIADDLRTVRKRLEVCGRRQWQAAVAAVQGQVVGQLQSMLGQVHDLTGRLEQDRRPSTPALRQIIEELEQIKHEFGGYDYDAKEATLTVTTDPITLEDVNLGPFEIRLQLKRLGSRPAYLVVALEPNPPSSNDQITHPHVNEQHLCEGDATVGIDAALQEGRLCDFFLLVRSVLQHYNPHSPYVSLDRWYGIACDDCGHVISGDDQYTCDGCDHTYCESCVSYCQSCDASRCSGCLSTCPACESRICSGCEETCSHCGKGCCSSCIENDLCPDCHKQIEQEQQEEQPHEQSQSTDIPAAASAEAA